MAENQVSDDAGDQASSSGGGLVSAIAEGLGKIWDAVTGDGYLAAMGRQGIDELGTALKAFPDSISVDEPGTLWNPTQGEIASDRADGVGRSPWPSEIASQTQNQSSNDNGNDRGYDGGYSM